MEEEKGEEEKEEEDEVDKEDEEDEEEGDVVRIAGKNKNKIAKKKSAQKKTMKRTRLALWIGQDEIRKHVRCRLVMR